MSIHYAPRIAVVQRPKHRSIDKIVETPNVDQNEKLGNVRSPDSFTKSTSPKVEEILHDKKQKKTQSNLPSITNNSVSSRLEIPKTKPPLSKPLIIGIVAVSLIAIGALIFGLYSFIQMSKTTTTTTTAATSGLTWCSSAVTVAGAGYGYGCSVYQLQTPFHGAFDSYGAIYIADFACNRISKWTTGSLTGTIVAGQVNAQSNSTPLFLYRPSGVSIDSSNNIYVADTYNHRVQFWSSDGSSIYTIAGTGSNGSALNQLSFPYSVALDSNSNAFYVADANNHRILRFVFNVTNGTLAAGGQGPGTGTNQLSFPTCVYFDSISNSLFIVNMNVHSVVQWVLGASIWKLIAGTPGSYGSTSLMLYSPQGLTLDPAGNVYVADTSNHRIQLFRSGNPTGTTIAGSTSMVGASNSLLNNPRSITLDKQLNLYVSDTNNDRVQMFQRC